jgi:hypothetical protein
MDTVNVTARLERVKEETAGWGEQARLHLQWQVAANLASLWRHRARVLYRTTDADLVGRHDRDGE